MWRHWRPYCLVVPVINEGAASGGTAEPRDLGHVRARRRIIADDGSVDGSLEEGFLRGPAALAPAKTGDPGKLSAQLRCAYAFALIEGHSGIVTIDGSGKDSVSSLPRFIRALDAGIDYAQASRFIEGGEGNQYPPFAVAGYPSAACSGA